mgnify:CR=1 FL=1
MNLVGFVPVYLGVLARRSTDWATSHHGYSAAKGPLHLAARTSVHLNQLTFLVYHYYRLQFATDRLWVATVVIIWPISSAYRCICIIFVQSWPDISALHSPGGSAYNQCRHNGGWCAESKVLQWRSSEQPVLSQTCLFTNLATYLCFVYPYRISQL